MRRHIVTYMADRRTTEYTGPSRHLRHTHAGARHVEDPPAETSARSAYQSE